MDFISEVIGWYEKNKRALPWRNTKDPYIIWLSEVILQQTRVDQGLPYFFRFSEMYPSVAEFAKASEDEILRMWQGLGYYSRGRNMHRTAQLVMQLHKGVFPSSYDELINLKGIGEYTAAAISSFSINEPKAVVDGNVFRVLARYFGIKDPINTSKAKKLFTSLAQDIIDTSRPGLSNQAMMEFGALHCRPRNPLCGCCPLQTGCIAFRNKIVNLLPAKTKKAAVRNRYFTYVVLMNEERILMSKRGPKDIWQNLHELPLFETPEFQTVDEVKLQPHFKAAFGDRAITQVFGPVKHVLTHQKIHAQFIVVDGSCDANINLRNNWFYTEVDGLEQLAQPKLICAFLKKFLT